MRLLSFLSHSSFSYFPRIQVHCVSFERERRDRKERKERKEGEERTMVRHGEERKEMMQMTEREEFMGTTYWYSGRFLRLSMNCTGVQL